MCSGACRAGPRFCFAAVLLSCATTSITYHSFSLLSTTFLKIFIKFFQRHFLLWFGEQKNETNRSVSLDGSFHFFERRKRDLNPRAGFPTYTLSRGASSASWVFLQVRLNFLLPFYFYQAPVFQRAYTNISMVILFVNKFFQVFCQAFFRLLDRFLSRAS